MGIITKLYCFYVKSNENKDNLNKDISTYRTTKIIMYIFSGLLNFILMIMICMKITYNTLSRSLS